MVKAKGLVNTVCVRVAAVGYPYQWVPVACCACSGAHTLPSQTEVPVVSARAFSQIEESGQAQGPLPSLPTMVPTALPSQCKPFGLAPPARDLSRPYPPLSPATRPRLAPTCFFPSS